MKKFDHPPQFPRSLWLLVFLGLTSLLGFAYFQVKQTQKNANYILDHFGAVPGFQLLDQDKKKISLEDLKGVIWIVDFIFTRCQGPCPILTSRLAQLSKFLKENNQVRLVSVSVDPDYDVPEILNEYAKKFNANLEQWSFLTGTSEEVEALMVKGMMQSIIRNAPSGPIHSTQIVVVDPQGQIRAFRDGTDPQVVPQLLNDIRSLQSEIAGMDKAK